MKQEVCRSFFTAAAVLSLLQRAAIIGVMVFLGGLSGFYLRAKSRLHVTEGLFLPAFFFLNGDEKNGRSDSDFLNVFEDNL